MRTQENGTPFEKVICGNDYNTFLLSGTKGTEILLKISKMYIPTIGVVLDEIGDPKNKKSKSLEDMEINISDVANKLVQGFDVKENLQMIKDMVIPCTRNGKPVDYDFDFRGQYNELIDVLMWVIKINFGDFFLSLFKEKLTSRLKEAKKAASESQAT